MASSAAPASRSRGDSAQRQSSAGCSQPSSASDSSELEPQLGNGGGGAGPPRKLYAKRVTTSETSAAVPSPLASHAARHGTSMPPRNARVNMTTASVVPEVSPSPLQSPRWNPFPSLDCRKNVQSSTSGGNQNAPGV